MTPVLRHNRKGSNEDIIRMNSIGFSLAAIAKVIDCHPTSITLRLKSLKIKAADTRRAFMDDIFSMMPAGYQDIVADVLVAGAKPSSVKDYICELVIRDVEQRKAALAATAPTVTD